MNALLALPLEVRLAGLFVVGVVLGQLANWGIYALAWHPRPISPWQRPHPDAPPRRWSDRLPIVGWLGLAREAPLFGRGFWVRPLLLELACGIGLAWLYHWQVVESRLAPPLPGVVPPTAAALHQMFVSHAILFWLMLVATFIDFDEKTIPDEITISGTLLGLALAALWPQSHLPVIVPVGPAALPAYKPLLLTSSHHWPVWLDTWRGVALGAGIFAAWCVALIPALATLRRGWRKGIQFYFASIARDAWWWKLLILAAIGAAVIALVWHFGAGEPWQALLTSLVGLGFGGGLIWAVRIVGWVALRKEAMGFGDVTLMAMIGAFLGWQACLIVFFLSPFAALVIAVAQWLLTRRRDIAFGPYLCLSALIVVIYWTAVWDRVGPLFPGWLLPTVLSVCLLLMMGLLMLWRIIEQLIHGEG